MVDAGISKEYLMELIADEKEALSSYKILCQRYNIPPNVLAVTVATEKINLLQHLLDGKTGLATKKR